MTKSNMTYTKTGGKHPFKVKDVVLMANQVHTENSQIKKPFVHLEYTPEQAVELSRCKKDPVYFIENYTRIISVDDGLVPFRMYKYQRDMVDMYANNKRCITTTLRQAGKCVSFNTNITVRNKRTGEEYELPIGVYYQFYKFLHCGGEKIDISQYKRN